MTRCVNVAVSELSELGQLGGLLWSDKAWDGQNVGGGSRGQERALPENEAGGGGHPARQRGDIEGVRPYLSRRPPKPRPCASARADAAGRSGGRSRSGSRGQDMCWRGSL